MSVTTNGLKCSEIPGWGAKPDAVQGIVDLLSEHPFDQLQADQIETSRTIQGADLRTWFKVFDAVRRGDDIKSVLRFVVSLTAVCADALANDPEDFRHRDLVRLAVGVLGGHVCSLTGEDVGSMYLERPEAGQPPSYDEGARTEAAVDLAADVLLRVSEQSAVQPIVPDVVGICTGGHPYTRAYIVADGALHAVRALPRWLEGDELDAALRMVLALL